MDNKEKNFVSAVIYVHNAERRIAEFLQMVMEVLEENFDHSEIICVNDCCADGSVEQIRLVSHKAETTNVSVLNMSYFHGIEAAMNAGVDLSIGDFVYEFDSVEMDYEPEQIMKVYRRALEGYDIVSASSNRRQRLSSLFFYRMFDLFSNLSYQMGTETFRILSRRVINRINSMNKSVPYRKAAYANCGLKTDNLVYQAACRETVSDWEEKKYRRRLAVDTLILFTDVGYQFSITMTVLMMLFVLFVGGYTVITYLFSTPVEGWTTTILFLAVAFFGLFGILTVIIKYLQLLVELIFRRKRYSFESIEKLT